MVQGYAILICSPPDSAQVLLMAKLDKMHIKGVRALGKFKKWPLFEKKLRKQV